MTTETLEENPFYDIDMNQLDEEWKKHPNQFFKQAQSLINAREKYERAKAERELVEAELDLAIRKNPEVFELEKVTEAAIAKLITVNERYQKANKGVLDAKHEVDVYQVAVDTMEHRKKALENIVTLWSQEYFSKPHSSKLAKQKWEERQMETVFRKKKKKKDKRKGIEVQS